MIWLVFGGISVLLIVVAFSVWALVALLAEVGDEQDAGADEAESDTTPQPVLVRSHATRH